MRTLNCSKKPPQWGRMSGLARLSPGSSVRIWHFSASKTLSFHISLRNVSVLAVKFARVISLQRYGGRDQFSLLVSDSLP